MNPSLSAEISAHLRCIRCRAPLERQDSGYRCPSCGQLFPVVHDVVRFVPERTYADSFGYQWHCYSTTQLDSSRAAGSERDFLKKTGLKPEDLKGKLVLDVGCGMGRFAEVATRWGARVIGIDLSTAAEVAAKNLAERDFMAFQADVFALPFAPETFDSIYSVGVLHHTPSCEQAFKVLPQLLKPGGTIAVWLYSGYNKWYRFSDIYRKITHRMSIRSLHRTLRVAVPFFYYLDRGLLKVPLLGKPAAGLVHHIFPVSRQRDRETRMLDTLDWYSPTYQSKHTYEQVFRWFEACGLTEMSVAEISIAVRGRKPLASQASDSEPAASSIYAAPGRW
jgi:SAM-dependent methyltransferase